MTSRHLSAVPPGRLSSGVGRSTESLLLHDFLIRHMPDRRGRPRHQIGGPVGPCPHYPFAYTHYPFG